MPGLYLPTLEVRASFLEAMDELAAEEGATPPEARVPGDAVPGASFEAIVRQLHDDAREDVERPAGLVPATTWWWLEGAVYLGRITLRHRLTPALIDWGGHLGYDVRPSARGRGHGTAMLRAVLPHARARGFTRVLVTCEASNTASRRVIEKNGGALEDRRGGALRFWVPT